MNNAILILSIIGSFASIYALIQVIRDLNQKKEKGKALTDTAIFVGFSLLTIFFVSLIDKEETFGQNEKQLLSQHDEKLIELEKAIKQFESKNFAPITSNDIQITETDNHYIAKINLRQNQEIGKYVPNDSKLKLLVNQVLKFLIDKKPEISKNDIEIYLTGIADRMNVRNLVYMGEYGELISKKYFDEDESAYKKIELKKNQRITNSDLAFLRAFNIMNEIHEDLIFTPNHIEVKTKSNDEIGESSRNVIIEMKVKK